MRMIALLINTVLSHRVISVREAQKEVLAARMTANSGIESEAVSSLRANIKSSSY